MNLNVPFVAGQIYAVLQQAWRDGLLNKDGYVDSITGPDGRFQLDMRLLGGNVRITVEEFE